MREPASARGRWASFLGICRAGAGQVAVHRLRSTVTVLAVAALVLPYLVGAGISEGLGHAVEQAVRDGPDLHVTAQRYGRAVPMPLSAADRLRAVPGVREVSPRIVGELPVGRRLVSAVVVGLPSPESAPELQCVEGRWFAPGAPNELVLGSGLAAQLGLGVGDPVPPFYRNEAGERVSRVVGIFRSDAPLWQSHAMVVSLETAWNLFAEKGTATTFVVNCPGYLEAAAEEIRGMTTLGDDAAAPPLRPRVTTRDDVQAALLRRVLGRQTFFQLPFVLAFAIGIPVVLVTSGAGRAERRRNTGLLRALGWSQDALLLQSLAESAALSVIATGAATLLCFLWLGLLGGAGIVGILLPGAGHVPGFRVPWTIGPVTLLLAFVVPAVLVATGTLYSTWRDALADPAEAMR